MKNVRNNRHSQNKNQNHGKVITGKGLRDRRVRLSAHTAIQFYDLQDRLGFDRPSKAIDWLIDKAKPAIDKLRDQNLKFNEPEIEFHLQTDNSEKKKNDDEETFFPLNPSHDLGLSLWSCDSETFLGQSSGRH